MDATAFPDSDSGTYGQILGDLKGNDDPDEGTLYDDD